MEKKNKNMVAVILKVYAIVNAIIGCIIGLSGLSDSYNEIFNMVYTIFLGACIVVSFGIYAFGEVVQLLRMVLRGLLLQFRSRTITIMTNYPRFNSYRGEYHV